tara:strand:- start:42 stop:320 length:279 start_codon:yes stop_codon:yes gene_type:complete
VKRPEPFVEWNVNCTIVAFEVAMMQVMEVVTRARHYVFVLDDQILKPRVAVGRHEPRMLQMKNSMQWMGQQYPMKNYTSEVEKVFYRMHRKA